LPNRSCKLSGIEPAMMGAGPGLRSMIATAANALFAWAGRLRLPLRRDVGGMDKRTRRLLRLMSYEPKVLERAYEIARSGMVGNVVELASALKREGVYGLEDHFTYTRLRRELNKICREAWVAAGNAPLRGPKKRKGT
jgi:hypothetical protein